MSSSPLLTPKEVASELRVDHLKVLDLIAGGAFPNASNIGGSGRGARYRIPQADLDRFLKSRRVAA